VIGMRFTKPAIPFDVASELISYVAYPKNDQKRVRFAAALCRVEHLRQAKNDPQWRFTPRLIKPFVFAPNEQTFRRDLSFGLETLRKHLITATLILLPHLQSFRTGKKPQTIEGLSPTVDNITQIIAGLEGWDEVESQSTFETRAWSPVRPVAHLAFCIFFKLFGRLASDTAGQSKTMFDIISPYPDEESLHDILRTSESVRSILPKLRHLRFTEDETIQFVEAT